MASITTNMRTRPCSSSPVMASPAQPRAAPCSAEPMGTADTASASAPVFSTNSTDTAGLNTCPTMRV